MDHRYIQTYSYKLAYGLWHYIEHTNHNYLDMDLYIFDLYKLDWWDIRSLLYILDDNLGAIQYNLIGKYMKDCCLFLDILNLDHKVTDYMDPLVGQEVELHNFIFS